MNNLMCLPQCNHEGHGKMELRPVRRTYEQRFCGVWYDCKYPGCNCSVLFPSKELLKQNESFKKKEESNA